MTDKDLKDMTASELLRKAGNGYEGASGTVMTNLIDLMGLSRKIRHSECFYDLADKIDAELAQDRKEAVEESKKPMWWFRAAIERGEGWPEPREGESFRHYLDRCFLPRPRFEDGEPVQFGDETDKLNGVEKFIFLRSGAGCCQMQDADGNICNVYPSDRVKRPVPEVLGADGLPIVVGEVVYPIDVYWLGAPLNVIEIESLSVKVALPNGKGWTMFGADRLTHKEPDTQERIDCDAKEDPCAYFGIFVCEGCPADKNGESCDEIMIIDLLRRQRELDARKGGE